MMIAEGIQHFGKIDILVNNAGIEKKMLLGGDRSRL